MTYDEIERTVKNHCGVINYTDSYVWFDYADLQDAVNARLDWFAMTFVLDFIHTITIDQQLTSVSGITLAGVQWLSFTLPTRYIRHLAICDEDANPFKPMISTLSYQDSIAAVLRANEVNPIAAIDGTNQLIVTPNTLTPIRIMFIQGPTRFATGDVQCNLPPESHYILCRYVAYDLLKRRERQSDWPRADIMKNIADLQMEALKVRWAGLMGLTVRQGGPA